MNRLRAGGEGDEGVRRLFSSALLTTALGLALGIVGCILFEAACR